MNDSRLDSFYNVERALTMIQQSITNYYRLRKRCLIMLVHTGNQQNRAGMHTQIIYNTGPIQEIQQATEVMGKEDHHVFYYIVI